MTNNLDGHHPMNAHPHPRPTGFTLTEVLIVILIIAILAALLFPLASGMREKARAAVCAQNLKQIGIGLHAHISENSGRFPNGAAFTSFNKDDAGNSLGISWYDAAAQNMGRENYSKRFNDPQAEPLPDVFGCPSGHGKPYLPEWPYTGDYAGNLYLGQPNHKVMTLSAIKQPSSTPYVQDTVCQNNFGVAIFAKGASKQAWKNKSKTQDPAFADRHGGSGNILWVDGHVSPMKYSEYMDYATDPARGGTYNFVRGNW